MKQGLVALVALGMMVGAAEAAAIAEELKKLEAERTDRIDIVEFVPAETVDLLYIEKSYYLGPDKGGDRAYKLLARRRADGWRWRRGHPRHPEPGCARGRRKRIGRHGPHPCSREGTATPDHGQVALECCYAFGHLRGCG